MATLSELMSGILPAVRGVGQGAMLGLQRYPAAAGMTLLDRLVGEGKLTYEEALALIREQDVQDVENYPKARIGGEIVGSVANALGTGGAGLARTVGRTALQGGVQGFTQNAGFDNTLRDVGQGAAIGGAFGLAGGGLELAKTKGAKELIQRYSTQKAEQAIESIDDLLKLRNQKKQMIANATGTRKKNLEHELMLVDAKIAGANSSLESFSKFPKQFDTRSAADLQQTASRLPLTTEPFKELAKAGGALSLGGLLGLGSSYYTGMDPWQSLAVGGLGLPLIRAKGGAILKYPNVLSGETAARLATNQVVPRVSELREKQQTPIIEPRRDDVNDLFESYNKPVEEKDHLNDLFESYK